MEVTSLQIWEGRACSRAVTIQNYSTLLVQGTLAGFLTHMHTQTNTYTRLHTDTQSRMPPTLLDTLLRPHITFQSDWNASSQLGSPSLRVRVWETGWWSDVVLSPCQWEDCVYECVCVRSKTLEEGGNPAQRVVGVILCNVEIISFYQRAFEKLGFLRWSSKLLGLSDVSLTFLIAHYWLLMVISVHNNERLVQLALLEGILCLAICMSWIKLNLFIWLPTTGPASVATHTWDSHRGEATPHRRYVSIYTLTKEYSRRSCDVLRVCGFF